MNPLRKLAKEIYIRFLFLIPHNNLYSFHCVSDDPLEKELTGTCLREDSFKRFVDSHGPYVSVEELLNGNLKAEKTAALTFDDGLRDVYSVAYPYLKKAGIPFTIFVLADRLDREGYITTEQLLEMAADPLVTVGSHGLSHLHLGMICRDEQEKELCESRKKLESLIGREVSCFAYPFGSYNRDTLELCKKAGYRFGLAVKGRPLFFSRYGDPYAVARLSVHDSTVNLYSHS